MNSVLLFDNATDYFSAAELEEARARPAIRHFEGPGANKPWHVDSTTPHREAYFTHRRATPWPRGALDGASRLQRARQALMPMRPV
jgi:hypothetical protein